MTNYILRRLLQAIPLLIGITLVTFMIMQLAPGDPMRAMIDPRVDPAELERLEQRLGLDRPAIVQYFSWLKEISTGNLGYSIKSGRAVFRSILDRLPATLYLTGTALSLSFLLGIPLGVLSATRRYSMLDHGLTVVSFLGISIPAFFFGLAMIFIFSLRLGLVPTSGFGTIAANYTGLTLLKDRLIHLILPATVLAFAHLAQVMRHTRSSMLEVLSQDFVRTARAKGLNERVVIYKHAFRNALIPVITVFGLSIPFLFSGTFVTETIFMWPGMGRLAVDSVFARDYPIIMGINLFTSTLVLIGNLLADTMYAMTDPRIRYS